MPVVDFYMLTFEDMQSHEAGLYCCDWIEQRFSKGHRIYIHTSSKTQAETLDELLWTFRETSFLPHTLCYEELKPIPPIQIGYGKPPQITHDTLLNLTDEIPAFFGQFHTTAQFVPNQEDKVALARELYRSYRAQGCVLNYYDLRKAQ